MSGAILGRRSLWEVLSIPLVGTTYFIGRSPQCSQIWMSALPPIADINGYVMGCPLLTHRRHYMPCEKSHSIRPGVDILSVNLLSPASVIDPNRGGDGLVHKLRVWRTTRATYDLVLRNQIAFWRIAALPMAIYYAAFVAAHVAGNEEIVESIWPGVGGLLLFILTVPWVH